MPPTVIVENEDLAARAVENFGRAILKPMYSTKARGMTLVDSQSPELHTALSAYREAGNRCFYVQKVLPLPDRDYGVVFIGSDYVGSYARVKGKGAWNTTSSQGGHYECYQAPNEVIDLAKRAGLPFGLDYTSVDVAEVDGQHVVFEVSAFGGFRGLYEGCNVDIASRYAAYIQRELDRS